MQIFSKTLFKTVIQSFYSKEVYREAGHHAKGLGFTYLILAISLFFVPVFFHMLVVFISASTTAHPDLDFLIRQIPETTITKGEVSVEVAQPYYIYAKQGGEPFAIIDTTHPITDWLKQSNSVIVIGKTNLVSHSKGSIENKIYNIPEDTNLVITQQKVQTWVEQWLRYSWLLPIIMAPFIILGVFLYGVIIMLLYGIFGLLFTYFTRAGLSYSDCVRVACLAATPGMALSCIAILLHAHIPGWVDFGIDMGYLYYGVRANAT